MNKIYSLVWNRALRTLQVASELATSRGGGGGAGCGGRAAVRKALALVVIATLVAWAAPAAFAAATAMKPAATGGSVHILCAGWGGGLLPGCYSSYVAGSSGGNGGNGAGVPGGVGGTGHYAGGTGGYNGAGSSGEGTGAGAGGVYGFGGSGGGSGGSGSQGGGDGGHGVNRGGGGGAGGGWANRGYGAGGGGGFGPSSVHGGGGGGGGSLGAHYSATVTLASGSAVVGGNGGKGGDGGYGAGGGGGGGGAGVLLEAGALTNQGGIAGGDGGGGGSGVYGGGGGGGGGGAGVLLAAGTRLSNTGTILGGNGGGGQGRYGYVSGAGGGGGVGVVAFGGSIIITSGTIAGGVSGQNGDGTGGGARADAIALSGGGNVLTLEVGSTVTGNIVSTSGTVNGGDTLILGDDTLGSNPQPGGSDSLDISGVSGFSTFEKTGTSTWTLTGTGTEQDWVLNAGTLQIGSSDGSTPGSITGTTGTDGRTGLQFTDGGAGGVAVTVDAGTLDVMANSLVMGGVGGPGGNGYNGGHGGAGIQSSAIGLALANDGSIGGGRGGYGGPFGLDVTGGAGGTGVDSSGSMATLTNTGSISGGVGGSVPTNFIGNGDAGAAGGTGIYSSGDGFVLTNGDSISGGVGGYGGDCYGSSSSSPCYGGTGGTGGTGIHSSGNGFTARNDGTISGGQGGQGGVAYNFYGTGLPLPHEGNGGAGIYSSGNGFTFANGGSITGGNGGQVLSRCYGGTIGKTGNGGAGIYSSGSTATLTNTGSISGGVGSVAGYGGAGVSGSGFTLTNTGGVTGGQGGIGWSGYGNAVGGMGATGGVGVGGSGFTLTNAGGTIAGGTGGRGGSSDANRNPGSGGTGGSGGAGVAGSGFTLANNGSISGGTGGYAGIAGYGGTGGVGVVATGGSTITTSGSIAGGVSGNNFGGSGGGVQADAIDLSGGGNMLVLQVGSSETGDIVSTSGTTNGGDTLTLGDNPSGGGSDSLDIGTVSGFTSYSKTGTSTWTLTGAGTSDQNWSVVLGILQGDATSLVGNITFGPTAGGAVRFDQGSGNANSPANATYAGAITGDGEIYKVDDGILILTGANTYSGLTSILGGTLQVGDNGADGSIGTGPTNIAAGSVLDFARTGALIYGGAITGGGALQQTGAGTLTLNGSSGTFAGSTAVTQGTLLVGDASHATTALGGSVTVDSGATLGGFGTVGGASNSVELASGAVLSPGNGVGSIGSTFAVGGGLTLDVGSVLDFDFGAPGGGAQTAGQGDSVAVAGVLDFEGATTLNINDAGSMGPGLYNLASYGSLVTNGCSFNGGTACIAIGTLPQGTSASQFSIVNSTQSSQINLYNTAGLTLNLWDPSGNPAQLGGSGTWSATSQTWTDTNGDGPFAMSPQPGFAIFQGTPGTVAVDASVGAVSVTGMQFAVDGYTLTGDAVTLVGSGGAAPILEVGDGSSASAAMTATVGNELDGDGFAKTGAGTLVLTGPMHLQGDIEVQAGTLQNNTSFANALEMAAGTTLANVGRLNYTQAGLGDAGAAAVTGAGFTVVNGGYISGGYAGDGDAASGNVGGTGGVGIQGSGFTLTNNAYALVYGGLGGNGSVAGGAGGAAVAGSDFTVTNAGYIYGWAGGFGPATSGVGGAGIAGSGFAVTNSGRITGGYGGNTQNGTGGLGGAGVSGSGFVLTNTGTIVGGEGGSVLNGTGTAGLGGAGIYSTGGATVINEGTINGGLSGDGVTRADAIDFTGGGNTLELVAGHPGTLNGALVVTRQAGDPADTLELGGDSGSDTFDLAQLASGGLYGGFNAEAKSGASSWTLTGTGSSAENWSVEGGTLVGDATTFQGSIAFAPASGETATVEFDQGSGNTNSTPDGTFVGVISGAGNFVKSGDGTLTLTGANTFTGSTTIGAGTLQVGDGGTTGAIGTGAIVDNGALVLDRSDAVVWAGTISGSGAITQQGQGSLTVNGDGSAFVGTTNVVAGTLIVGDDSHAGASLGGMVTIAQGATLAGIGTIGGMDLFGALSPGGSIGTLHVAGDATFEQGSSFNVEASPGGTADQLAVGGKVAIKGGNTLVIAQPGNWAPQTAYTIITAGQGVSGEFDSVNDDQAFLSPTLGYAANAVTLTLARNDVNFISVATAPNEIGVAAGIEGLGFGSALYDAVVKLNAADAQVAFTQTSGEYHASQQTARIEDSRYVREAMNQRLRAGDSDAEAQKVGDTRLTAWAHAWGHWGTTDSDGNAGGLADNGAGLLIGADLPVGAAGRIGVAGGTSRDSLSIDSRNAWGRETSTWLGAFGGVDAGAFGFRTGVAYAWDQVPDNRVVAFPGYGDRLSGNASGSTITGFVEGAWTFKFGRASVAPFLSLAHTQVKTHASTETGGASALHAYDATANVSVSTLGARGAIGLAHHLYLHGELGWQHAYGDTTPERNLQFVAGGPAFTEYGVPVARNAGLGRIGIGWHAGRMCIDADYERQSGGGVKDQAAKLSISVVF